MYMRVKKVTDPPYFRVKGLGGGGGGDTTEEVIAYTKKNGSLTEYVYLYSSANLYSESGERITTRPNCVNIVEAVYTSAVGGGSWYDGWNLQEKLYMQYDTDGNLSILSDNTGTGKRISAVKYLSIPYSCLFIDTISEKTANREWNIGISYTYNSSKLDLFAINGTKFQFGVKTFGLRIQDYPMYYAVEFSNNSGRSPVTILYSQIFDTFTIRNESGGTDGCITPLFKTLPQNLKVIDIVPTSAPRVNMTRFVNGANRQYYPLRIYTAPSNNSELLFETKDAYLTFYADVVTELAGSKWGRVKIKQNDQEFIGYVESYSYGPIATDTTGVAEMLTNYLPLDSRRFTITDVGSVYVGGYIFNGNTDESEIATSSFASIVWGSYVFALGRPTGNNVFYASGGKVYLKATSASWSSLHVGDNISVTVTPMTASARLMLLEDEG